MENVERATTICLDRACDHPVSDHVATPELASNSEVVVWCVGCRRHEVARAPRYRFPWLRGAATQTRRRFAGST
jgi:hypothetical protein